MVGVWVIFNRLYLIQYASQMKYMLYRKALKSGPGEIHILPFISIDAFYVMVR